MYVLKGFVEVTALTNNTVGSISPLGELSNVSLSYAKEKGYYSKADAINVELISFTSTDDNNKIETPAKYHSHVLEMSQWVFERAVEGTLSDDAEQFRSLLLAEYGSIMADVIVGKMVAAKGSWMPSFISWTLDDGGEDNEIRIWYADEAFKAQYDDYEVIVVPPLVPVDTFQKVKSEVKPLLDKFNLPDHHKSVGEYTDGHPYTNLVTNEYLWHDREDESATLMTNWSVAIYGIAGNNPIVIKKAIADYILSQSAYLREDWIPVFPDIFTSTEFTIIPMWHNRSVPDESVRGELYSPIVSYNELPTLASKYVNIDVAGHTEENLQISTVHFKSLAFFTVGGIENRDKKYKLSEIFPDYALIQTTSADFNRLEARTTEWIIKLQGAIIEAEEMDEYSYLGVNFSRIERDGKVFVGFSYEDILYLILSRGSMDEANVPVDENNELTE